MLRFNRVVLSAVFVWLFAMSFVAAAHPLAPAIKAAPRVGKIVIDGKLDESAWRRAPAIHLTQQNPHPGEPTEFTTTIRILRGTDHVYFGIVCADPDPKRIAIHTLQRDADQSGDDNIMIVLDTFAQKKLAYVFQINAGGAIADGLISPGYQNGNGGSVDYNWNGYWSAAVARSAAGWTAEVRIDTQSLQFNNQNPVWGLNISRYVPRDQLTLDWSGISLNASVTNLQWEGKLTGIRGLRQSNGLEFDPYVVTRYSDTKHDTASWTGFDLKYNFTPELAGRFTYHTDFSESQANSLQVNASPYPHSIPETRAFFLEGANIFTFSHNLGESFIPFYSRSVGILNGETVPLNEGVKLLGHTDGWTLGLLDAQMGQTAASSRTNLFAGRASYNVNDHWRVGTLVTHGDPSGQSSNSLASFDSTWSTSSLGSGKNLNVSAWGARSYGDSLPTGTPNGYGVDVEYPNDLWYGDVSYNFYGSALDPAMGFVQRPGTKQTSAEMIYKPRPDTGSAFDWVRQFFFYAGWSYVTDLDNRVQSDDFSIRPLDFVTQNGWNWSLNVSTNHEVLNSAYELVPGVVIPAGNYNFVTSHMNMSSPASNPLVFGYSAEAGDIYSGHYRDIFPNVSWAAPGGHFTTSLVSGVIWIYTPQGNGTVRVSELNLGYSFNPDLTLTTLTQYNNISHNVSENAVLQWNIQPDRILYVVWNHGLTLNPNLLQGQQTITGNSVLAKLVWGFY